MVGDILGYARVSTGNQDVAGQVLRLQQAGAIKVFTDVRSSLVISHGQNAQLRGH